jgi:hypothetical protein
MENVAAVAELESQVRRRLVDATLTVDAPSSSSGSWWIDIERYGRIASVEWRPGKGFGVAGSSGGYGEGVDFVVDDPATAAEHIARILQPFSPDSDATQAQLLSAFSAHIDKVVGEVVHTTIEKVLDEFKQQVGTAAEDVRRIEEELPRIAAKVLAERTSAARPDVEDRSPSHGGE